MIGAKLNLGDELRVIAPARSLAVVSDELRESSVRRLEAMGFKVTFSRHASEKDEFNSSSIQSRTEDIHEAFSDKNVKGILAAIGGFNSNQLLKYLDYGLISANPKILCGYSDITALQNAVYRKTGLVTYSGPFFSSFGAGGIDYTEQYFQKCLMKNEPFEILPSKAWSDDSFPAKFAENRGFFAVNYGKAEGTIVGANLCTFNLLHGTEFMPCLDNTILFIEDDEESKPQHFDRDLQSIIHLPGFEGVKGIAIGRFQPGSGMTENLLVKIIQSKPELSNIPVIANVDFGHTIPSITFPIGGKAKIVSDKSHVSIEIVEH